MKFIFVWVTLAYAQDMSNMPGMSMGHMNAAGMSLMNIASGTSVNPGAWKMPMLMTHAGSWNWMFMGTAYVVDTQQSGSRGGDKLYSPNWFMASVGHKAGAKGAFQADVMLSLDPATITGERYPLLFQTGETAYGRALFDGQHPHNFVMSLGLHYAYEVADGTTVDFYAAPVGDPALGPVAYPHRASAEELPQAALGHHLEDSTHISDDVLTVGISHSKMRLEASGFHGAEPGENRWIIQQGAINSWSARAWYFPTKHWAAQVSVGRIVHPEALEAGDQVRSTASLQYTKGGWSSSLVWGRNHNTSTYRNTNAYLAETALPISKRDFVTGRAELVDKDELFNGQEQYAAFEGRTFRIGAYTAGYRREIALFSTVSTGIGANFSFYTLPDAIKPVYGSHPVGGNIFIRFSLKGNQ